MGRGLMRMLKLFLHLPEQPWPWRPQSPGNRVLLIVAVKGLQTIAAGAV